MTTPTTTPNRCRCIIRHPHTPEEREAVVSNLHHARATGSLHGIRIAMLQLTTPCPAKD